MVRTRRIFQCYFIPPVNISLEGHTYARRYASYSDYNYLQPGIASFVRIRHFEHALRLTREYFHNANVIDFACADGPLLPSLSKYFNNVVAIDKNPNSIEVASEVTKKMHLSNVELICNADLSLDVLKSKMPNHKYHILYVLETLEHIGDKSAPWDSRANFIKDLFGLVDENGIIVLSVPNMIGISFLLQRLGLLLLNQQREPISIADMLKASLFNDTTNLENQWQGGHLGFNHKKLENRLKKDFKIVRRKNIIFQVICILAARLM